MQKRETVLKSKQSKIEIGEETGRKEGKDGSNMRGGEILILMGPTRAFYQEIY